MCSGGWLHDGCRERLGAAAPAPGQDPGSDGGPVSTTRVLHLIKGLGLGGAEQLLATTVAGMDRARYEPRVVYMLPWKEALAGRLREASGAPVSCLGEAGRWDLRGVRNLVRLLRELRPDVVHAHLPVPGVLARLMKPLFGYRLVYTEHNLWQRLGRASYWLNRLTYPLNDVTLYVSQEVADSAGRPGSVLANCVDVHAIAGAVAAEPGLREQHGIPPAAVVVVNVANATPKKNQANLLQAFERLRRRRDGVHLVLIGQAAECWGELQHQAGQLGIGDRVHFHGPSDHVPGLLKACDVFCLSSDYEGLPISLLEAMAAGLAPVCTAVGGIPSVIQDGEDGLLVPRRDPGTLADALERVCADAELRRRLGEAARVTVHERYDVPRMIAQLEQAYEAALGREAMTRVEAGGPG